jgi:PAS domain S-box-containing protein
LGYCRDELVGKTVQVLLPEPFRAKYLEAATGFLGDPTPRAVGAGSEVRLLHKNGSKIPVEISPSPVGIAQELLIVATLKDISERQEIKEALAAKTVELRRSNEELQKFAYVASHDVREPLRSIGGFCTLLKQNYEERLDDQADRWIGFITEGVRRMEALIDDLLMYSRVESRARPREPTDFNAVVDQVVRSLSSSIEESGAEITHDELPTLSVEPRQAIQLLQNLVSNAIKYRSDQPPRLHISAEFRDHEWVFSIRDNGIGIRREFQERIFEVFRRLHNKDEYSGTGIGLAICRKIVQRHGGRIWVESRPGAGSTFFFTIPTVGSDVP